MTALFVIQGRRANLAAESSGCPNLDYSMEDSIRRRHFTTPDDWTPSEPVDIIWSAEHEIVHFVS